MINVELNRKNRDSILTITIERELINIKIDLGTGLVGPIERIMVVKTKNKIKYHFRIKGILIVFK